eukprot:CAMPEP_0170528848 /NCGR_PEP_ID=MMETSP0209-20121228/14283_1 /TAXON_ID=665100 ORGANISM="Litonotus pictus, Strain P1" /NCGR_SAMPLE_ID=MMETSP0209 /ASSEMBLY_ACC=CAM_ASM_000301 /LENGTH=124 /DNA_ID=CAMNT_0010820261 /DNA_START=2194 /DNA_END=2569 /DNA_ORIENTATION=+
MKKTSLYPILVFAYKTAKSLASYFYGRNKVKVELEVEEGLEKALVYSDEIRLKQVLLNFISNSAKFTKRGYIKIICMKNKMDNSIEITIEDTGIGMGSDMLEQIKNNEFSKLEIDEELILKGQE